VNRDRRETPSTYCTCARTPWFTSALSTADTRPAKGSTFNAGGLRRTLPIRLKKMGGSQIAVATLKITARSTPNHTRLAII